MPGKAGRFGADRQPTAMMQNFAMTRSPRSVSINQLSLSSSKIADVTRVSNTIWLRRSKRSATWLA